jgi:DUF1680 family protein
MKADGSWGVRRLCLSGAHWPAPKHCRLETHQCCVNNVPRGLLQLPAVAVTRGDSGPVVNLYVPGTATVPLAGGKRVRLEMETDYPESGSVRTGVFPEAPAEFGVSVRVPAWSRKTTIEVNGAACPEVRAGTYVTVRRTWRAGDRIDLTLDMSGRVVRFPVAGERYVAIERGPIVLARDIRLGNTPIHEPVCLAVGPDGSIELKKAAPQKGFWMVFEVPMAASADVGAETIPMCDFSSAGSTWDKSTSDFRVWLPLR